MPKRKRDQPAAGAGDGGAELSLPLQEQQLTFKLSLLPHAMEDMGAHVQAKLNGLLMKYHEEAGGVLLALSDLRLPKARPFATVMGDLPFLHLHVEATALVFAPRPGLALEGRVTKVARTHVALLVHDLFNAAIAREDMGPGFKFHHQHHAGGSGGAAYWEDGAHGAGGKQRMAVGGTVAFRVLRVHEAAGLIAMDGTLREGEDGEKEQEEEEEEEEEEKEEERAPAATNGQPRQQQGQREAITEEKKKKKKKKDKEGRKDKDKGKG